MLPKKHRIQRKLFTELLSGSKFIHSPHLTLRFKATLEGTSKAGVSVSKKISKSAVVRNTIRRRVYTSIHPLINTIPKHLFLFVAKPGIQNIKGEALNIEIKRLFSEVGQIVLEAKKSYNP